LPERHIQIRNNIQKHSPVLLWHLQEDKDTTQQIEANLQSHLDIPLVEDNSLPEPWDHKDMGYCTVYIVVDSQDTVQYMKNSLLVVDCNEYCFCSAANPAAVNNYCFFDCYHYHSAVYVDCFDDYLFDDLPVRLEMIEAPRFCWLMLLMEQKLCEFLAHWHQNRVYEIVVFAHKNPLHLTQLVSHLRDWKYCLAFECSLLHEMVRHLGNDNSHLPMPETHYLENLLCYSSLMARARGSKLNMGHQTLVSAMISQISQYYQDSVGDIASRLLPSIFAVLFTLIELTYTPPKPLSKE
jgi:hypothetical protein